MNCSSAAALPDPSAFQIWHNLQFKPTAFPALMAKSQRMNCIPLLCLGEGQTLPCRFLASPSRCLLGHFQEHIVNGLGVLCHPFCGEGSAHECRMGNIPWSVFLSQEKAQLLSTCRWKIKKPHMENTESRTFHAIAATHSGAEDSSNPTLWKELLGKVAETLKTILVPTEIAPGPRQNHVDTLNWWEAYVLFLKALHHFWQGEPFILCNALSTQAYFHASIKNIKSLTLTLTLSLPPQGM